MGERKRVCGAMMLKTRDARPAVGAVSAPRRYKNMQEKKSEISQNGGRL